MATRYKVLHEGNITTVSSVPFAVAAGTANAITANFTPDIVLTDGLLIKVRASGANTVTNPTIAVDGGSALTIYKNGNQALVASDIFGAGYDMLLLYTEATTRWELLNPAIDSTLFLTNPVSKIIETTTIDASTAVTGTVNYDIGTQVIKFYTANAGGNWIPNFRWDGSNTLNSKMSTGQTITVTMGVKQGSSAYYPTNIYIDGTATGVTKKPIGGTAPTAGNANYEDVYTYAITKTGDATYTVRYNFAKD